MFPWVPALGVLSWLGLLVHNLADLPGQTLLSPESSLPLLLMLGLLVLWFTPRRLWAVWGLLVWGVLNLTAAVFTVLPLSILPFDPAQTAWHYGFHVLYGAVQLPLVTAAAIWLRRRSSRPPLGTA
ncbi:hypothetical protein [Arthrobacter sp. zg-Y769]|uniref:hypothetical protein n=1 Tax=Arthrobacter sp. zg-Y769 TaxID=2894191 RepID=UPI001E47B261|nr:hypothetical protein [Arthrobacter sp. zg-Y769]MCC9204376.1 hypothetical protein [Arthrobacter sp. zg-Y769]